jgi:hypothetical protein
VGDVIRNRIRKFAGAVMGLGMVLSIAALFSPTAAFAAGTGRQYRNGTPGNYVFINAWGGGPLIKVFNGAAANNDFTLIRNFSGYFNLQLSSGNSSHDGQCISDSNGTSGDAKAGLINCTLSSVGWGANFTVETANCVGGGEAFHNVHWNGWLAPQNDNTANGTQFYLNSQTQWCFTEIPPF